MKQTSQRQNGQKGNPLKWLAGIVVLIALAVTAYSALSHGDTEVSVNEERASLSGTDSAGSSAESAISTDSDIVIRSEEIGSEASYFDYDADGTTVEVFAVRASDDTVRLALNTCQVCNGSPYAYFEQDGDEFVCQNCGNHFDAAEVGLESGGCNPVPITEDVYTEQDGTITIPAEFLEDNAARFAKWKAF